MAWANGTDPLDHRPPHTPLYVPPMPKITFVNMDGTRRTVDAEPGATLMETALQNDVPGVLATCGGSCSCATCHVYVDEDWFERLKAPELDELDMLDTAHELAPTRGYRARSKSPMHRRSDGTHAGAPDLNLWRAAAANRSAAPNAAMDHQAAVARIGA